MKIVLLFVFTCNFQRFLCQNCGGIAGNVCCNGYYWNDTLQSCQPCSVGFTGHNCLETCPYPGYGRDCQMTCQCIQPFCSHIGGCNTSNEELSTREIVSRSPLTRSSSSEASSTTRQHNCTKTKHSSKNSSGIYMSVISLTAISGVFLLLYIGLHCYMTRFQTNCLPPATSAI